MQEPHTQDTTSESFLPPEVSQCAWCFWLVDARGRRLQPAMGRLPEASHSICVPCLREQFPKYAEQIIADLNQQDETNQV
jgi:hypothetical protein